MRNAGTSSTGSVPLDTVAGAGWTGVIAGDRDGRRGLLAVLRSLCDVDVLGYTGNARFPSCWERKQRPGIRGRRSKRRVSSETRRHSKKVASPAKLWSVGGSIGVCRLRSSQPASRHGKRAPQSAGMWLKTFVRLFDSGRYHNICITKRAVDGDLRRGHGVDTLVMGTRKEGERRDGWTAVVQAG